MTDELTKTFFDTFGIEPIPYCCYHDCNCPINDVGKFNSKCPKQAVTKECDARIIQKPQITDRILLKLLSIQSYEKSYYTLSPFDNIDELKKDLLSEFIDGYTYDLYNDREDVKHQVQALFKEDN